MKYEIYGACNCVTGKVRDNNEDNYYFNGKYLKEMHDDLDKTLITNFSSEDNMIFSVFDGMGGEASGERASFLASKYLAKYIKANQDKVWKYKDYINKANEVILNEKKSMGTTVASVAFFKDYLKICNLGDSRIYLLRGKKLKQISVDHTDELLIKKLKTKNNSKPRLTQHLGISSDDLSLEPYITKLSYKPNDKILICTDGLTDMLTDEEITAILTKNKNVGEITNELVEKALEKGGKDNTTVMCFEIKESTNKRKKIVGIIFIVFLLLLIALYKIISLNQFKIIDECNSLIEGSSCKFKFDNKKYTYKIQDESIIQYNNDEIISKKSGITDIIIYKKDVEIYRKTIKVFPNIN